MNNCNSKSEKIIFHLLQRATDVAIIYWCKLELAPFIINNMGDLCYILFIWMSLTLKHRETNGCVVSTMATDALVLKHQVISIHNADCTFIVLEQFYIKTRQIWGIWKLRPAYSPETPNFGQNRWCFVLCDLEILWMTLENNKASLLCCFQLCVTFHSHRWIQTGVTVRKRPIWVKFDDF